MSNKQSVQPVAVTPADDTDLSSECDGIHVNGSGNVKFTSPSGQTSTIYLLAGVGYRYPAKRIHETGTSATGIHALYYIND
jgi:hypothetical protein